MLHGQKYHPIIKLKIKNSLLFLIFEYNKVVRFFLTRLRWLRLCQVSVNLGPQMVLHEPVLDYVSKARKC